MAKLSGSSSAEIDSPLEDVWALVEDVEKAPDWQGGLKGLEALERDDEGRATLCESETDAKIRTVKSIVRFDYQPPSRCAGSRSRASSSQWTEPGSWRR